VFVRAIGPIATVLGREADAQFAVHVQAFESAPVSTQGKASHYHPVARLGHGLARQGALSVPTRADSAPTLVGAPTLVTGAPGRYH
jgi:hypothetical protein